MSDPTVEARGTTRPAPAPEPASVTQLITIVVSLASVVVALSATGMFAVVTRHPTELVLFLVAALALAPVSVDLYVRGSFSFVGCGILAVGFQLGVGAAVFTALLATVVHFGRRRAKLHRALYTSAMWTLAAAAGTLPYRALGAEHWSELARMGPALVGGPLYAAANLGLLSVVMALSEGESVRAIWRERFRWTLPYYVVSGPLALALVLAYERLGVVGLFAFALPPWFMMFSVHQYLARTRAAAEEIHEKNARLEAWNADLHSLFEFASGLAAHATDRAELTRFAEGALAELTGGRPRLRFGAAGSGVPLVAAGTEVGVLDLEPADGFDAERWSRLSEAVLPQLATALESADLVERVRKTHLATIAALSRSMEAKDYYTGGHTERVATIAVALARRLGYEGADLDAVEIGALLHDIGKIGIPERVLHKPGPLDEEEWKVMKEHPVISDYILSEVDLPPIVREIARSSHERIDGAGYPDALAGDDIPLPARIVLVADALDALTSDRPYRRARPLYAALQELHAHEGTQFCPRVLDALDRVCREEPDVLGAVPLRAVDVA